MPGGARRNPEQLYGEAAAEARKHTDRRVDARVASFDLSLSDPKSISLLAAGSPPEVRAEVQAGRHAAIRQVLSWLEREAVGVRRGHNGTEHLPGQGFTAAAFDHRTSREGDPQWHTHVLVQNATLGPDGRWSALDSKRLYAHAMTADRLSVSGSDAGPDGVRVAVMRRARAARRDTRGMCVIGRACSTIGTAR